MSQKYDDYINEVKKEMGKEYPFSDRISPMIPTVDKELEREIRDRAIIDLVTKAVQEGENLSYGDIRLIIDHDPSEKEYEDNKEMTF